ncbi:MAG: molybdopterin cofactor-binding domain-containing protein, partial [Anaerolineales bacterium]
MNIQLHINDELKSIACSPGESLLRVLRREGYYSVRYGSDDGATGAAAVLLDGQLVNADTMLAAQAAGHHIQTIEPMAKGIQLHPIQDAFVRTGAIQCGYCTPAMMLATKELLEHNPDPSEADAREALSGVLCRCTGYLKPVQAVLEAAAVLRGEPPTDVDVNVIDPLTFMPEHDPGDDPLPPPSMAAGNGGSNPQTRTRTLPKFIYAPQKPDMQVVGKPELKVDSLKLAKGNAAFVDDMEMRGMLHAKLLTSPHAHARILEIDDSEARALPGVHAVLHCFNVPRVKYASGGQSYPNPKPYDQVSFDNKVRYVGDRVAAVAAESLEIAEEAIKRIRVTYAVLPAVFDAEKAIQDGAPVIHDEDDTEHIHDAAHNISHHIQAEVGDVEQALHEADHYFENTYYVHQVQQAPIEPHIAISWWDSDERLVIRTSTQVPFHTRRMVAPLLGLPVRRIRVIKPRIGGGFGVKQEMLIEDIVGHLTIATGRPVRLEFNRPEEFISSRTRHPQKITFRSGVNSNGKLMALDMHVLGDTGPYATHGLTVQTVTGLRGLSTYNVPNMRFDCSVVYTNKPVPGAYRGYGGPQALF